MTTESELRVIRRAFAKQILAAACVSCLQIEDAFAAVPREAFLGPGPWQVVRIGRGYVATPDDDPVHVYTDSLVGLSVHQQINNGEPSLHARLLAHTAPAAGEHVLHVGAGTGYYAGILSALVGPSGQVTAVELDPYLARQAAANLAPWPQATVVAGNGGAVAFSAADVIYVNVGVTHPPDAWLDGLADGGRLVLPLTTADNFTSYDRKGFERRGAVFLITRSGGDYLAKWISPVGIFPGHGLRDAAAEQALTAAFQHGDWRKVTRLYRTDDHPADRCWLRAPGWCLAYA